MIKNLKNIKLDFERIVSYWTLIFCLICLTIATYYVITIQYIGFYQLLFSIIGLSFVLLSYVLLRQKVSVKIILKYILFALIAFFFALFLNQLPILIEFGPEIEASISRDLFISIVLGFYGLIGSFLAFRPIYNFSAHASEKSGFMLLLISILLVLYPVVLILFSIFQKGYSSLTWEFLTNDIRYSTIGTTEAGIYPAIVGTLLLILLVFLVAVPLGIGTAIYLEEYAKKGIFVRIVITCVNILRGTPSVVYGLFGLAVFAAWFGPCLLAAGLTLSFYALPMVIRSSQEALKSVPQSLREGSLALGATKWETIRRVVIPPALPGVITGSILGIGEASGETAPILFLGVSWMGAGVPDSLFDRFHALPYQLYESSKFTYIEGLEAELWATALVLLGIVLIMNIAAIILRERFRREF